MKQSRRYVEKQANVSAQHTKGGGDWGEEKIFFVINNENIENPLEVWDLKQKGVASCVGEFLCRVRTLCLQLLTTVLEIGMVVIAVQRIFIHDKTC